MEIGLRLLQQASLVPQRACRVDQSGVQVRCAEDGMPLACSPAEMPLAFSLPLTQDEMGYFDLDAAGRAGSHSPKKFSPKA